MLTARLPTTQRTLGDLLAQAGRAGASGEIRISGPSRVPHRIAVRSGNVVAVRLAGRFDPLLERLLHSSAIDDEGFLAVLESLATSERLAGELAIEHAGVTRDAVRDALMQQAIERLSVLLDRGLHRHRDAWLLPRAIAPRESAVVLDWQRVVRGTTRARTFRSVPVTAPTRSRDEGRRELRRLARALHPDLNAHLPRAERDALAAQLARATAAFHAHRPTG